MSVAIVHPYKSLPDLTGGACLDPDVDRDAFYPEKLGARQQAAYAVAICKGCPVRERCLTDALDYERQTGQSHGIWAGLTEHQRAAILKREVA